MDDVDVLPELACPLAARQLPRRVARLLALVDVDCDLLVARLKI